MVVVVQRFVQQNNEQKRLICTSELVNFYVHGQFEHKRSVRVPEGRLDQGWLRPGYEH